MERIVVIKPGTHKGLELRRGDYLKLADAALMDELVKEEFAIRESEIGVKYDATTLELLATEPVEQPTPIETPPVDPVLSDVPANPVGEE